MRRQALSYTPDHLLAAAIPALFLFCSLLFHLAHRAGAGQLLLTGILLMLPRLAARLFALDLPDAFRVLYALFILGSSICGEMCDFYTRFSTWDLILHTIAGVLFAAIGWSITHAAAPSALRGFGALSAFCFSVTCSAVWEFFEFAADRIADVDMQKDTLLPSVYSALTGEHLAAHIDIGLTDTMEDMLLGAVGALLFVSTLFLFPRLTEALEIRRQTTKKRNRRVHVNGSHAARKTQLHDFPPK